MRVGQMNTAGATSSNGEDTSAIQASAPHVFTANLLIGCSLSSALPTHLLSDDSLYVRLIARMLIPYMASSSSFVRAHGVRHIILNLRKI